MNVILLLAIILFLLMIAVGGRKGARSFIALFLNFLVVIGYSSPIIITLIACLVISCINLFYINHVNTKTITAFIATVITTLLLVAVIVIITNKAMIHGLGEEELEELDAFSLTIGIDFLKLAVSVIIMSTIGAITDAAMAISSPMRELHYHQPQIKRKDLFRFGLTIGRDIIGTSVNTLFFAFFGSYLALIIWFKDLSYSFSQIINSKIFSSEMITICCSAIGVILVIPVTAWITSFSLTKHSVNNDNSSN